MRDLESIKTRDLEGGHFDIYIDDIEFSDYQYQELMEKDICRISEINRDDIKDESIFEKLKEVTYFLKKVLQIISNGEAKVMFEGVKSYTDKIIETIEKDGECLKKLDDKTFCHEDLLENILLRYFNIKFAAIEKIKESQVTDAIREKYEKEVDVYNWIIEVVNRYRNIV